MCKKPWKVHVNITVSPVTLTDVHDHLYGYGGFPPLVDVKMGLLGMHPKPNCKGDTVLNRSWDGKLSQPWFLYVCNSHLEADNLNYRPLISEVFLNTRGLSQLTTLLCSIIMSSVYDNIHQNCNILQYCLIFIGTNFVT